MPHTAADLMQPQPSVASPTWSVAELERAFFAEQCSGFPVVNQGELVGVVSRSDVLRRMAVDRSREGELSDFFREYVGPQLVDEAEIHREETRALAEHLAGWTVADLMSPPTYVVEDTAPIGEVAALLVQHHIHRVPVVSRGALVGIISSLDLVATLAGPS